MADFGEGDSLPTPASGVRIDSYGGRWVFDAAPEASGVVLRLKGAEGEWITVEVPAAEVARWAEVMWGGT